MKKRPEISSNAFEHSTLDLVLDATEVMIEKKYSLFVDPDTGQAAENAFLPN